MTDVRHALKDAAQSLMQSSSSPRLDAELLLMQVLHTTRAWLYAHNTTVLISEQFQRFNDLIQKRQQGMPVAYLTGYKEFWSMELLVNENTLIPRPETELLVEKTLEILAHLPQARILELGTGSGAISLALAKERPHWQIEATDISMAALETAHTNAKRLLIPTVTFLQSNWFSALSAHKPYDAIISNPPYIREGDPHLTAEDIRFEPLLALTSGCDGLNALRQIIQQSPPFLKPEGWLLFEHGYEQAQDVHSLLFENAFQSIACWQDGSGQDRISGGQCNPD